MSRLRILAVAYACDPSKGSEYGVGWGWTNAIAADHDVTVLTADFNAPSIEHYFAAHGKTASSNLRFRYVTNQPWHYRPAKAWLKIEESFAKPLMNLAYQDWLRCAFNEAKQEVARDRYDLVHLITFVGWRFPGNFYRLGIPFVWGPIGGMKNTPWRLLPILGAKGAVYYGARNLINSAQRALLQGPRRALRAANQGVIAATSEIQRELQTRFGVTSRVICEVGPPEIGKPTQIHRSESEVFRICWSGQHLPGKALHLLLAAAARLPDHVRYRIEIVGDGPCRKEWQSTASRLGINQHCNWRGWISRVESLKVMSDSHVFVITSLKDLTSTVAVEAISLGVPVITLDHCGFSDLVPSECGIKIYPGSARQIATDLAAALHKLYMDEALRLRLAAGALVRSRDYSWSTKMQTLNDIYGRVLSVSTARNEQERLQPLVEVDNQRTL